MQRAYSKALGEAPRFTREEEVALWQQWRDTQNIDARNALVMSQMQWAIRCAMQSNVTGSNRDDWESFAAEGVMKAIDHFDPCKGRLSTIVPSWVRICLQRGFRKQIEVIHTPRGNAEKLAFPSQVSRCRSVVRMDAHPHSGRCNIPYIPDRNPNPSHLAVVHEETVWLYSAINRLSERDREIATKLMHGRLTHAEIAKTFGISRSRIGQVRRLILARLRELLTTSEKGLSA